MSNGESCKFCDCLPCMCGRKDYVSDVEDRRRTEEQLDRKYSDHPEMFGPTAAELIETREKAFHSNF